MAEASQTGEVELPESKKLNKRYVKGLLLADTLGKGTFGYVKLGIKEETGQQFALKFLLKNNKRFKLKQIQTEINCMKKIQHPNVIQLLHADYDCEYPNQKTGKKDDTVLMVLEYAPGGDLYDILFYTGVLDERLTRTYLSQLAKGVEALHKVGITHRDLKANNILLDHKFRVKITDFGLSHVFEGGDIAKNRMKTTWVGTRGYQAPELILNRPFSYKCDIFSMGVVVFTLMCGHQPFKEAAATDPWYKCIAAGKPKKFWNAHKTTKKFTEAAKNCIEMMISYQPKERVEIKDLYEHEWLKNDPPLYDEDELVSVMKDLHQKTTKEKMQDPKRLQRIQDSQVADQARGVNKEQMDNLKIQYPVPEAPRVIPAKGCFVMVDEAEPLQVLLKIHALIEEAGGKVEWARANYELNATITLASEDVDFTVDIICRIFQHPDENNSNHIFYIQQENKGKEVLETFKAWDNIWLLASQDFREPYQPTYNDELFTYDPAMFEETTTEEEVQSAET